jgi:hypothetical protein
LVTIRFTSRLARAVCSRRAVGVLVILLRSGRA